MMQGPRARSWLAGWLAGRVSCIMPSCNAYLIQGQLYYSPRLYSAYIATENKWLRNRSPWPRQAIEREGAATRLSRRGGIKLLPRLFQAMISLPALRLISGRRSRGRGRPGRSAEEGFSPCFLLRKLSPDKMADFSTWPVSRSKEIISPR